MSPKLKYLSVNWENGMNISKEHFIQQENAFTDRLNDVLGLFLNSKNYGLLPVGAESEGAEKTVIKIDNQKFLKVKIFQCRAVCQGGTRIEILEEHQLPELEVDISKELELAAKEEGDDYFILLSVDPFNRQPFGDLDAREDPPRYPFAVPSYKVSIMSEKQLAKEGVHPASFFIGKLKIENGTPEIYDDYIPPCMTVKSHQELARFYESAGKFFSQLELDLLSIIRKINEKKQDTSLARSVLSLSENLLRYVTENHLRLQWEISDLPPIYLFMYIANAARVIRNTIDSNAAASKEELLNYFTNWSELKQGDFEKLLVYCINFEYRHFDLLFSVEQFTEFIQIIALLFDKLESLAYIGKKKETNIFVKEQKPKRSFLAD
ncbi:hypothetical protein [Mariniphaga sediminis]|uniref:hypothetical protein n=1 Tax=Mariniphaga sediminis TaxID=1628158 RepID=UPI0035626EF6